MYKRQVKYVVSDGKVAAPADHVEKATWTRTLTLDKVTGKELSATPWASDKTAYAAVPTPVSYTHLDVYKRQL